VDAGQSKPVVLRSQAHTRAAVSIVRNGVEHVFDARPVPGLRASVAVDVVPGVRAAVTARGLVRGDELVIDDGDQRRRSGDYS